MVHAFPIVVGLWLYAVDKRRVRVLHGDSTDADENRCTKTHRDGETSSVIWNSVVSNPEEKGLHYAEFVRQLIFPSVGIAGNGGHVWVCDRRAVFDTV